MARLESISIGGYYPTPYHLIPLIQEHLYRDPEDPENRYSEISIADPCAGEGSAICGIKLGLEKHIKVHLYTCEMEKTRYETLQERLSNYERRDSLHGDAFRIDFKESLVGLLFLNPPYDTDPVHGRLEEAFLNRFTQILVTSGVLVYIVPIHALKASANTLALHFEDLQCFRFPKKDFEAFKQIVLFARKTERLAPDPKVIEQIEEWSKSVADMPVVGSTDHRYHVPSGSYYSGNSWRLREFDLQGLVAKARPWKFTGRHGVLNYTPHILPDLPVEDLLFREFPVATPPRPAHIAAGIASGLFNGRRVSAKTKGMPDLLVKGVFDREYVTIEEKQDRQGNVTGLVQVQQPKLVTTVLDLETKKYTTLKTGGKTGTTSVEDMTIEDLLDHYGPNLMQVMAEQCPVLYDPKRDVNIVTLAPTERKLFTAQDHAAKAILKLLGGNEASKKKRRFKAAFFLGEIGSGKTTVAVTVAKTITNRVLVMCPPHLLQEWVDETRKIVPDVEIRLLTNVSDVDDLQNVPKDRFLVAILSRESGKLSHGVAGVTGACPKCGATLPEENLAKKRSRCSGSRLIPVDAIAQAAQRLALRIAPCDPENVNVKSVLRGRFFEKYLGTLIENASREPWKGCDPEWIESTLKAALKEKDLTDTLKDIICQLLLIGNDPERIAEVALQLGYRTEYSQYDLARRLTLFLPPRSDLQNKVAEVTFKNAVYYDSLESNLKQIEERGIRTDIGNVKWTEAGITVDENKPSSLNFAKTLLGKLSAYGNFKVTNVCGEPLFQATPDPRKFAIAKYICRKIPDFFGLLCLDEGHEYATDGSAQERSAHRLTSLGLPTILMTGSVMNGYAESLFTNMWALSSQFREEFARGDRQRFIDRYGYRKRLVSEKDKETGEIVSYGSMSDRVERSERIIGNAEGVLPLFFFRHLLKLAVTLHKSDLALDLPECHQIVHRVDPDPDLKIGYINLLDKLKRTIQRDRFEPRYAGKLFGALAEIPSYLDRATTDTGNQDDGRYEIRYPESLDRELVVTGESFDPERIMAKEGFMLNLIRKELAEDRNVMVFAWHICLLPRLARLISQEIGEPVPILYADKVPTGKRKEWINKNVVSKGRRVMVANPVAIQTGLNNLVHFSSEIWMENPACNPTIFRQAVGRIDRIGATKETRVHIPVYQNTLQEQVLDLLLRKVAVAVSADGLDPESALIAAGAAPDGYLSGLSIGKQLWAMLNESVYEAA